jgi:hypothetical protein
VSAQGESHSGADFRRILGDDWLPIWPGRRHGCGGLGITGVRRHACAASPPK